MNGKKVLNQWPSTDKMEYRSLEGKNEGATAGQEKARVSVKGQSRLADGAVIGGPGTKPMPQHTTTAGCRCGKTSEGGKVQLHLRKQ